MPQQRNARRRKENARAAHLACWRAHSCLFNCERHFFTRLVRSIACSAQGTNCQQSRVVAHYCSAPSAWRHASRSAGSLLSTRLEESNDTTIFRLGQTSINTMRKISCPRQTKRVTKNRRQIIHFSSKFNLLTDWYLENQVIVNSALTLADMIHGFGVLWPLKYLWYLVGSGVGKKQCLLQTPTKTKQY
jgi:hypothetical protein